MVKNAKGRIAVPIAAVLSLLVAPLTASADDVTPPTSGTLHITKLEQPAATGTNGTGVKIDDEDLPSSGIADVTFTAWKLPGYDLLTADGWAKAKDLADDFADATPGDFAETLEKATGMTFKYPADSPDTIKLYKDGTEIPPTKSDETDDKGYAELSGLPLGLYIVRETGTPANVVPALPFLVTVPMTDPVDPANWMYHVWVYPKNSRAELTKKLNDGSAVVKGDKFTYEIEMAVPKDTVKLEMFDDLLDPRLVPDLDSIGIKIWMQGGGAPSEYKYDRSKGKFIFQTGNSLDDASLILGSDLGGTTGVTGRTLGVSFTGTDALKGYARVQFTFQATVNDGGTINNQASYRATTSGGTVTGDSNVEVTYWDRIDVLKVKEDGTTPLAGAEFKIALSEQNAIDGKFVKKAGGSTEDLVAISDANGRLSFVVHYPAEATSRDYWIVETKAPASYEQLKKPIKVTVAQTEPNADPEVTVTNHPHNTFELPKIGGNRAILPILATLVVGGGVVWLIRSRRVND